MIRTLLWIGWTSLKRDRVGLLLTFALPIAFFSIFVGIFGGAVNKKTGSATKIVVVDEDQSQASQRFVDALRDEKDALRIITAPADAPDRPYDRSAATSLIKSGDYSVALVIPKGFGKTFPSFGGDAVPVDLIQDTQRDPVTPQMLMGIMQKAAMMGAPDLMIQSGIDQFEKYTGGLTDQQRAAMNRWLPALREEVDKKRQEKNAAQQAPASAADGGDTDAEATDADSPQGFGGLVQVHAINVNADEHKTDWEAFVSFQAAQTAVMFLLFSMSGAAGTLLEEQESGTLERVLSSKVGMTGLLMGKWLFIALVGMAQLCVMFLWAWKPFGLSLWTTPHLLGFGVMTVATAVSAAAFGLVLATACKSRGQLSGLSTIVILVMSAVGGCMFPRFLMSESMQRIGLATFNAWALDGYRKVFYDNLPLWQLWPQVVVLLGLAAAFMLIARTLARRWETA